MRKTILSGRQAIISGMRGPEERMILLNVIACLIVLRGDDPVYSFWRVFSWSSTIFLCVTKAIKKPLMFHSESFHVFLFTLQLTAIPNLVLTTLMHNNDRVSTGYQL